MRLDFAGYGCRNAVACFSVDLFPIYFSGPDVPTFPTILTPGESCGSGSVNNQPEAEFTRMAESRNMALSGRRLLRFAVR